MNSDPQHFSLVFIQEVSVPASRTDAEPREFDHVSLHHLEKITEKLFQANR
jgi:hypothetical protein